MKKRSIFSVILSLFLIVGLGVQSFAATTQEKIADAQDKQQENKTSLDETREKIAQLEEKKDQSESYMEDLKKQLEELGDSLKSIQDDYEQKQKELTELQTNLEQAKEKEAEQYNDMKIRIRYIYEKGTSNYWNILLQSESIVDFLNQAENISKITQYDRKMLDSYTENRKLIAEQEKEVAQEKEELAAMQKKSQDSQDAVMELVEATYQQIRAYKEELSAHSSEESKLLDEIQAQEDSINELLKQAIEEEAARRLAEAEAEQRRIEEERIAEEVRRRAEEAKRQEEMNQQNSSNADGVLTVPTAPQEPQEPQGPQISQGGSIMVPDGNDADELIDVSHAQYLGRFKLTAYCPCPICCGKWSGGGTASGVMPTPGRTVAMAGVPFGTKLLINGHLYTVEDRGTAYGHVDIFFASHGQALQFGMKHADVYLIP